MDQLMQLLQMLSNVHIYTRGKDRRIRSSISSRVFSMKSFSTKWSGSDANNDAMSTVWNIRVPPSTTSFTWLVLHNSIPTVDRLRS